MRQQVTRWTVDYGDGRIKEVRVPHAWRQDVDVRWEGPAVYKTLIDVPYRSVKLLFHGVSYLAEVHIDGHHVATHEGIWDAFEVNLDAFKGKRVEVHVRVTKNGGEKFPVKETLAGFLPYVYHTFGGVFRPVELTDEVSQPVIAEKVPLPANLRGILHWGWYPELGHCHPNRETIEKEVDYIQSLGFNTVKFCLWLPPHEYLEILHQKSMVAWIELPLWLPKDSLYPKAEAELDRIVRQYAHHPNVVAWTVGCELSNAPAEFREKWVKKIQTLTKSPWVKDNSGGAEMYGGDPKEFGTFEDFHPYGEAHFFPSLLDSLELGPRTAKPILLGETCDHDVHRDLAQVAEIMPYWASSMRELNDQGVRWQYDIPKFLSKNRFAQHPDESGHSELMARSLEKALFVRKHVVEQIRARSDYRGYVLTGHRDTPISSSGILTDWGRERYRPEQFLTWNADSVLFLIQSREPRWTRGGNRTAFRDMYHFAAGQPALIKVGYAGPPQSSSAIWRLTNEFGHLVAEGVGESVSVGERSVEILQCFLSGIEPGTYQFHCEFGGTQNDWTVRLMPPARLESFFCLSPDDRFDGVTLAKRIEDASIGVVTRWDSNALDWIKSGKPAIVICDGFGTEAMPFWRESITETNGIKPIPWEILLSICPDQALLSTWLDEVSKQLLQGQKIEILENRIDTRTYAESPYLARIGKVLFTTYRVYGGHGSQPNGLAANIAGQWFLESIAKPLVSE